MLNSHDDIATKNIKHAIRQAEVNAVAKYPILKHQNSLGLSLCLFSLLGMIFTGIAYIYDVIPAWACIIFSAFFASISHELEHDLIHRLYFRNKPIVQNLMLAIVWVMRPNTVNPWYRRKLHFNHHKVSGTELDIEERVLGNGMGFGLKRMIASLDGFLSISIRIGELNKMKNYHYFGFVLKGAPLAHLYVVGLYGYLLFIGFDIYNQLQPSIWPYPTWLVETIKLLEIVLVVWILPNLLRAFCLHNLTAALHYYGDVDSMIKQCQIMNHWMLLPFQAFCFNFGGTHALHHFVVNQPFYLRQLVARQVYPALKENGVRFNDFGSLLRANRFDKTSKGLSPQI